ncbi:unnamed protein product [Periconia digitata]|uniref:O-methyltransferase domain-containing protein n=1 Tax=Periconia digitata TaxID=1303443 RepID=A0A9W4UMD6_9PLEO|nr:unnamed protein product [Periconia digitata]
MSAASERAGALISELRNIVSSGALSEKERVELLQSVVKFTTLLEKPEDAITKLLYTPSRFVALRVCSELKLFNQIVEHGPITSKELAHATGVDQLLIERLLRVLTASDFVTETAVATYAPSGVTEALATRLMTGMVEAVYDVGLPGMTAIPEYLRNTSYKNPHDAANGPWQLGRGIKDQQIFSWLQQHPRELGLMQTYFEADRGSRPNWVDWFPVEEKLIQNSGLDKDQVLLVDVAGGRGHELSAFLDKFPNLPGRLILQDQPHVLDDPTLGLDPRIEKKTIDFWVEGPVQGARIYYMKFILHDWSDEQCLQILSHLTAAMDKSTSLLVVEDFIIPDTGCHLLPAMWDIEMMAFLSAMERTRSQWQKLLSAAGLDVLGMYDPPGDGTGIIVSRLSS